MARSTHRRQITDYTFGTVDPTWGSLPPISFRVKEGPFEISDYFTLEEAAVLSDELIAAIREARARQAAAMVEADDADAAEGRSIAENDAIQAEARA